jgi:serine/threonine protein kinase
MEHLAGVPLDRWIGEQGPISLAQADNVVYQICHALDYAHGRRMVHRDIKPSNIMIGPEEHATLMDFGLARAGEDSGLTRSGVVVGTAEYMAPEHALGQKIDGRSDVYSFGVVIYKMLTGTVPFSRSSSYAVSYAHIYEPPPLLRQTRPDLSPAVEAVVLKALAKDPADRYQRAGHLARDFAAAVSGETPADLGRWLALSPRTPEPQPGPASPPPASRSADDSVTEPMEQRTPRRQATIDAAAAQPIERRPQQTPLPDKGVTEPMVRKPVRIKPQPVATERPETPRKPRMVAQALAILAVILLASITGLVLTFGRPGDRSSDRGGSIQSETLSVPPTLLPSAASALPASPTGILVQTPGAVSTEDVEASVTITPTVTLVPTVTPTPTETRTLTPRPTATRSATAVTTTSPTPTGTLQPTDTLTPKPGERPLSTPATPPTARPTTPPTAPPTALPTAPPTARPTALPTAPPTTPPTAPPTVPPPTPKTPAPPSRTPAPPPPPVPTTPAVPPPW